MVHLRPPSRVSPVAPTSFPSRPLTALLIAAASHSAHALLSVPFLRSAPRRSSAAVRRATPDASGPDSVGPKKVPVIPSWNDDDDDLSSLEGPVAGPTDYDPTDARSRTSGERDVLFSEDDGPPGPDTARTMFDAHLAATGGADAAHADAARHAEEQRANFEGLSALFGEEARVPDRDPDVYLSLRHAVRRLVRACGGDAAGLLSSPAFAAEGSILDGFVEEAGGGAAGRRLRVCDVGC